MYFYLWHFLWYASGGGVVKSQCKQTCIQRAANQLRQFDRCHRCSCERIIIEWRIGESWIGEWYIGDILPSSLVDLILITTSPLSSSGSMWSWRYCILWSGHYNILRVTEKFWVRIYATETIKPGDEIFVDYGEDFWAEAQLEALSDPALLKSTITPTSSSLWAAPAPIPDISGDSNHHQLADIDNNEASTTPTTTLIWPTQVPPPSSPTILGHFTSPNHPDHDTLRPICFPHPLSPVTLGPSPNLNRYMNEEFSLNQMHNLDDTLLLPINITPPPPRVNVLNPQSILL